MNKITTNLFCTIIFIYLLIHLVMSQNVNQSCPQGNDSEDSTTFGQFMERMNTFTFSKYSIEIKCPNNDTTITYDLNPDIVWTKRYEIYDQFRDDMFLCRNCTSPDFQQCMKTVRRQMISSIDIKTQELNNILTKTKTELESTCV